MHMHYEAADRLAARLDLRKLNSITKYPSIPTYHQMGQRGRLTEELSVRFADEDLWVTEKIDGTNARVIVFPATTDSASRPVPVHPLIVGSREELLHADGDRIYNPALGIVDTLKDTSRLMCLRLFANHLQDKENLIGWPAGRGPAPPAGERMFVLYGEVYGGQVGNAKAYGGRTAGTGFRLFDVACFSATQVLQLLDLELEKIASWRDAGCTPFLGIDVARAFEAWNNCFDVGWVPNALHIQPSIGKQAMPTGLAETREWLKQSFSRVTRVALGEHAGEGEGYVIRNGDRSVIAKLRYEDYERAR